MSADTLVYEAFDGTIPHTTCGPYTAEDYLQLPEGERVELLRGRLIKMSPSPVPRHQLVGAYLWSLLQKCAVSVGGLAIPAPMDVLLGNHTVAQPDVVYIRADHMHQVRKIVHGAPDLLVEVLWRSTAARDRIEKLDLYATAGVSEYWIVDPETDIFEFHILDGQSYRVTAKDSGQYQSPLFPEVSLDLTEFWNTIAKWLPEV